MSELLRQPGMSDEDYERLVLREAGKIRISRAIKCTATTGLGMPCQNPAVRGRSLCQLHGGLSGIGGVDHVTFRSGRYSKYLPANLRESYERGLQDEELLSLREELALMKARVTELASHLVSGEGDSSLWDNLKSNFAALKTALDEQDEETVSARLERMALILDKGASNDDTWQRIKEALDGTQKLATAEWKRLVDLRQLIAAPKAIALIMSVVSSIQQHVKDRRILAKIQNDINAIVMNPGLAKAAGANNPVERLSEYGKKVVIDEDMANRDWEEVEAAMRGDIIETKPESTDTNEQAS